MEDTTTPADASTTLTCTFMTKMTPAMRERIDHRAETEGCSRSEIVRRAITQYVASEA